MSEADDKIKELIAKLKSGDVEERAKAAGALGKIGDASAVPSLIKLLRDKNEDVRGYAASILGEIGSAAKEAVPALTEALKDKNWNVRWRSAWALGEMKEKAAEAVPGLVRLLEDRNVQTREHAVIALGKIGDDKTIPILFKVGRKHPELHDVLNKIAKVIAEKGERPSGVRVVDERPQDFSQVVRGRAFGLRQVVGMKV